MIITAKSETYNHNIQVSGVGCNAHMSIINTTPCVIQKIQSGGASGPPGLGADPAYIAETEQRLTNLENDEHIRFFELPHLP